MLPKKSDSLKKSSKDSPSKNSRASLSGEDQRAAQKKTDRKKKEEESYSPASSKSGSRSRSSSEASSVTSEPKTRVKKQGLTRTYGNRAAATADKKEKKPRKIKTKETIGDLQKSLEENLKAQSQSQSVLAKRSNSKIQIDSNDQDSWLSIMKKTKMNSGEENKKNSQANKSQIENTDSDDDLSEAIDYKNRDFEDKVYDLGIFGIKNKQATTKWNHLSTPPAKSSLISIPQTQSSSDSKQQTNSKFNGNSKNHEETLTFSETLKDSVVKTLEVLRCKSEEDLLTPKDVPKSRLETIQAEFDTKIENRSGSFQSQTTLDSHLLSSANNENSMEELKPSGSFAEGDVPVRVLAAKPIPEEQDLELLILWRRRSTGVQPEKSKIMRLEFLGKGYHMLLAEYYERKMKLPSISNFNSKNLPQHYPNSNNLLI